MTQRKHQVNLASDYLPVAADDVGATTILLGADHTWQRRLISPDQSDANSKLPQTLYASGFMPAQTGWASVAELDIGFGALLPAGYSPNTPLEEMRGAASGDFIKVAVVKNAATTARALAYIIGGIGTWKLAAGITIPNSTNPLISTARVQGHDYLFIQGIGLFIYTWATDTWAKATMDGLVESELIGIVSAAGYLIAYSQSDAAWSTTFNLLPDGSVRNTAYVLDDLVYEDGYVFKCTTAGTSAGTEPVWLTSTTVGATLADGSVVWTLQTTTIDFVPSSITGAGGGAVEEATGPIVYVKRVAGGFILYTNANAVAALYTANASFPFIFKEIQSCGGLQSKYLVTDSDAQTGHIAYTSRGLQLVTTTGVKGLYPEWARSLDQVAHSEERVSYAYSAGNVVQSTVSAVLTQLVLCGGRFLAANLGESVSLFDLTLLRPGRVGGSTTSFVFNQRWSEDFSTVSPESIGVIGSFATSGSLTALIPVYLGPDATAINGTLIFGNFKHVIEQDITMLTVEFSGATGYVPMNIVAAYLLTSYDGRTWGLATAITLDSSKAGIGYILGECCQEGVTHAIYVEGSMHLTGITLTYTTGGHST